MTENAAAMKMDSVTTRGRTHPHRLSAETQETDQSVREAGGGFKPGQHAAVSPRDSDTRGEQPREAVTRRPPESGG